MGALASIRRARESLRTRLDALPEHERTVEALLELTREIHAQTMREAPERHDVTLQVETFGHSRDVTTVELVVRWTRADALEAPPCRLRLRFEVPARPEVREALVRSWDYPHQASFIKAALEATELDRQARASRLRLELDTGA